MLRFWFSWTPQEWIWVFEHLFLFSELLSTKNVFAVFVLGSIFLHGLLKIVFKLETAQEIEVLKRNLIEKAGYFLGILFIAISIYLGVTSYDWDWRFVRPEFSSQASWSDTSGIMGLIFLAGTFQVRKNRSVFSVLLIAAIMMPLIFFYDDCIFYHRNNSFACGLLLSQYCLVIYL